MFQVVSEIDRGHPTPSELALDGVPARERGTEQIQLG
jgi:hypothetical protein